MLRIEGVSSGYGNAEVLRGVDLEVPEGRVVALLGRNGMGKTSLIRTVMGLQPPQRHAGTIVYRDRKLTDRRTFEIAREGIALVPQGRRLFRSLSVVEHLTLAHRRRGENAWTVERVFELFPRLGERRNHMGNQLSGGERQMLAVGRALVTNPDLLLTDEPSEGLAPIMVQALEQTFRSLKASGLTMLLVEQNLHSALSVADDVSILENGRIVYRGAPAALMADKAALQRHLGV
jgi:branched-chain amino acid transport system ATP-binding protein